MNNLLGILRNNSLNGWVRLWIVFCGIYLVVILVKTVNEFPSQNSVKFDVWDVVSDFPAGVKKNITGVHEKVPLNDLPFEVLLNGSYYKKDDKIAWDIPRLLVINDVQVELNKDIKREEYETVKKYIISYTNKKILKLRVQCVGMMTLFWVIPCVMVYILGWSINWIRIGFKKKE